jgi:hypothetical protein
VTSDLKSPGNYERLDYSNFGSPVVITNPDPKEKGQCARGIHVFSLTKNINFFNVIFANTLILLHVKSRHIIFKENNGKMRVSQATPIKRLTEQDSEYQLIRKEILKTPKYAYKCAKYIDQQPRDETRNACLINPCYAYFYALDIDQQSRDDTRNASLKDPFFALQYAKFIDQRPRDDTRNASLKDPYCAYLYALHVDQHHRDDTYNASLNNSFWAFCYAKDIDKITSNL